MKKIKRLFAFTLALIIAMSCFCISVSAVESDAPDDNGNMELDVVFVLDSSGSMAESDPNRIAPDAFKLFVDLCDESCGVGYTIYSEKIKESENITTLDKKHLDELRSITTFFLVESKFSLALCISKAFVRPRPISVSPYGFVFI